MLEKASCSSILRYGPTHPRAVYDFLLEYTKLKENKSGRVYSIDLPGVGMPGLYGLYPGWIVPEKFNGKWSPVYGKSDKRLIPLLNSIGQVDIFLHDSEHSYRNMLFKFSSAPKFMKDGSLVLSDDVRSNSVLLEAIGGRVFKNRVALLTRKGSGLGGFSRKKVNPSLCWEVAL